MNVFKSNKKDDGGEEAFEGVACASGWLKEKQLKTFKDCNGDDIPTIPISYLNDDDGMWKSRDTLLKNFINKLKNPVMLVKEYEHDFIKETVSDKIMKFAVTFRKKPSLRLGMSFDGSKVLKGVSDGYYFYQSDVIRLMIFEDSVENEKKMREII